MTTAPTVLGLDLSLAGTGCATRERTWRHRTRGQRGDSYTERLARITGVRSWVLDQLIEVRPDLIVIEGPNPKPAQVLSYWDRAPLWWAVLEAAQATRTPLAVAPPASVKKFATDNGNCKKLEMIAACYDRGIARPADENEADAAWLMALGHHWLGDPVTARPLPLTQARAANGVLWPERSLVRAA